MKKIEVYVSTGYVGAEKKEVIEVEDALTEDEINELCMEWLWENIEFGWYEKQGEQE